MLGRTPSIRAQTSTGQSINRIQQILQLLNSDKLDEATNIAVNFIKNKAQKIEDKDILMEELRNKIASHKLGYDLLRNIEYALQGYHFTGQKKQPLYNYYDPTLQQDSAPIEENIFGESPSGGNFNLTDLDVTISSNFRKISAQAKKNVAKLAPFVGKIFSQYGQLGSCVLINSNLILTPLHCIKNYKDNIEQLEVQFLNISDIDSPITCQIKQIEQHNEYTDMVVIELIQNVDNDFTQLNFGYEVSDQEELLLISYPSSGNLNLQVSGNRVQVGTWDKYSLVVSHDSDNGSSGGIYINSKGQVVGIHIGRDETLMFNNQKYAYIFNDINREIEPDSPLYDFLVPEGIKSAPKLIANLKDALQSNQIPSNISEADIKKLVKEFEQTDKYPSITSELRQHRLKNALIKKMKMAQSSAERKLLNQQINKIDDKLGKFLFNFVQTPEFLNIAGVHGETSDWSIKYAIESEHPLPHRVFKNTTNLALRRYL